MIIFCHGHPFFYLIPTFLTRHDLIQQLQQYQSSYTEEQRFKDQFLELLKEERCFERDHLNPGHITGSAWIVDKDFQFALLTHHAKLNRWLQPGGHADGDENVLRVALREAEEETGLVHLKTVDAQIFDLDIHTIPAKNDIAAHLHYDVRFLFIADLNEPLIITEESHDLQWIVMKDLEVLTGNNRSVMRMAEKCVKHLLRADQQ